MYLATSLDEQMSTKNRHKSGTRKPKCSWVNNLIHAHKNTATKKKKKKSHVLELTHQPKQHLCVVQKAIIVLPLQQLGRVGPR